MMLVVAHALAAEERALIELDRARSRLQCFAVEERIAIVGRVPGKRSPRLYRAAIIRFEAAGRAYFAMTERTNRFIRAAKRRPLDRTPALARDEARRLTRPSSGLLHKRPR